MKGKVQDGNMQTYFPQTDKELDLIDQIANGRRVIRTAERTYVVMPAERPRRYPCGACGEAAPVPQTKADREAPACLCQVKPKRAASDHVTEQTPTEVRTRLGLPAIPRRRQEAAFTPPTASVLG